MRFASEVKAILASGIAGDVDPAALPTMLSFGYTPASRTMYRGIAQLPPASTLVFAGSGEPTIRRYWRAPFAAEPVRPPVDEACSTVRSLVEAAVERRLEADVPLGAFLSGGVDSTIVVGIMARLMERKVKTFSIGFSGDARFDETRYARIAAGAFGTEHVEFTLQPSSFDLVERLVQSHDGPFGDSSAIPTSIVSQLTRQHVTVALSGDGGDELFCGYPRFLLAEAEEKIPAVLRRAALACAERVPAGSKSLSLRARRLISRAALPLSERLVAWNSYFAFELDQLLLPEVRASLALDEAFVQTREVLAESEGATVLSRILDHNFETYLPHDLLVKADRASMLHSLEVRAPFLDTALIEYVARLPDSFRRRGTTTKWILKRAFRDLIPSEIQKRSKMGFGLPLGAWFRGDLKPYLLDHFHDRAEMYEYVERGFVRSLLQEHFEGRADHGSRLWLLLTLQIWLRARAAS